MSMPFPPGPGPGGPGPGGPPSISIGGPPPGAGSGGPANNLGGGGDVDPAAVKTNLQAAVKSLMAAQAAEGDDADAAQISQIVAKVHTLIAGHQQLQDKVMGGGPGVKMVRKAGPGA